MNKTFFLMVIGLFGPCFLAQSMGPQNPCDAPVESRVIDKELIEDLIDGIVHDRIEPRRAHPIIKNLLGIGTIADKEFIVYGISPRNLMHREMGRPAAQTRIKNAVIESRYLPALRIMKALCSRCRNYYWGIYLRGNPDIAVNAAIDLVNSDHTEAQDLALDILEAISSTVTAEKRMNVISAILAYATNNPRFQSTVLLKLELTNSFFYPEDRALSLPFLLALATSTYPPIRYLALRTVEILPDLTGAYALSAEERARVLSVLQWADRTPRSDSASVYMSMSEDIEYAHQWR